jgi:3-oxoacyl-[acyl-carrier-protein] synthase III
MTSLRSVMIGVGGHLPSRRVANATLEAMVDTSDTWIRERSGIEARHVAGPLETTADLATYAAEAALRDAGCMPSDIDLIICATATPDQTFPATATLVQARLGAPVGIAFDLAAVCTGFVYALTVADAMLANGSARRALVIGAETFSRILDWTDRSTCVLFGDGAGAVVLEAMARDVAGGRGILANALRADGRQAGILNVNGGASRGGRIGKLTMQGQAVFRQAVTNISEAIEAACAAGGVQVAEIDWFVPHQANKRILEGVARRLSIPEHKVIMTLQDHGNTSAASVPLALDSACRDGRIKRGDLVLLEAMGGGLTWGANLVRF